jgi:hypothetical protein
MRTKIEEDEKWIEEEIEEFCWGICGGIHVESFRIDGKLIKSQKESLEALSWVQRVLEASYELRG